MGINLNLWSFFMSLCCIILFFIASFSATFINLFVTYLHFHPLNVVLLLTILCFFLTLIGMKDVNNTMSMLRSFISIVLTLLLASIISFILFIGSLLC